MWARTNVVCRLSSMMCGETIFNWFNPCRSQEYRWPSFSPSTQCKRTLVRRSLMRLCLATSSFLRNKGKYKATETNQQFENKPTFCRPNCQQYSWTIVNADTTETFTHTSAQLTKIYYYSHLPLRPITKLFLKIYAPRVREPVQNASIQEILFTSMLYTERSEKRERRYFRKYMLMLVLSLFIYSLAIFLLLLHRPYFSVST